MGFAVISYVACLLINFEKKWQVILQLFVETEAVRNNWKESMVLDSILAHDQFSTDRKFTKCRRMFPFRFVSISKSILS